MASLLIHSRRGLAHRGGSSSSKPSTNRRAHGPCLARLLHAELQLPLGLLPVLGVPAVLAAAGLEDLVGALRDLLLRGRPVRVFPPRLRLGLRRRLALRRRLGLTL